MKTCRTGDTTCMNYGSCVSLLNTLIVGGIQHSQPRMAPSNCPACFCNKTRLPVDVCGAVERPLCSVVSDMHAGSGMQTSRDCDNIYRLRHALVFALRDWTFFTLRLPLFILSALDLCFFPGLTLFFPGLVTLFDELASLLAGLLPGLLLSGLLLAGLLAGLLEGLLLSGLLLAGLLEGLLLSGLLLSGLLDECLPLFLAILDMLLLPWDLLLLLLLTLADLDRCLLLVLLLLQAALDGCLLDGCLPLAAIVVTRFGPLLDACFIFIFSFLTISSFLISSSFSFIDCACKMVIAL